MDAAREKEAQREAGMIPIMFPFQRITLFLDAVSSPAIPSKTAIGIFMGRNIPRESRGACGYGEGSNAAPAYTQQAEKIHRTRRKVPPIEGP